MGVAAIRELWDEYVLPLNRFIAGPVDRALADYRPDVVVADQYALAGALAASRAGLRWATLCSGVLELDPPAEPGLADWVRSKLAQVRQAGGGAVDDDFDPLFSPYLVLATTSRALLGPVPLPAQCVLIGAALGPRPGDPGFRWDWWDADRQHVLVTAGTISAHHMRDFFARMLAALEPLAGRVQAILNTAADAIPNPPPHVLVAPRVPMLDLMPRLDAVICQAGQSTVNEALAHGVPLVVAPIRLAEPITAAHVTRAGAGIAVSHAHSSPAELTAALVAVLDEPAYRVHARRIATQFAADGGAAIAAERLIALARTQL